LVVLLRLRLAAALLAAGMLACVGVPAAPPAASADTVVLLHGLGRGERMMRPLARRLEAEGYRVENLGYRSLAKAPGALVRDLDGLLAACCAAAPRVHFVGYSLGGILLRAYLAEHRLPNLGRVVMLGPPNHGSELADLALRSKLLSALAGPTAVQLGTGPESLPNRLPPPSYPLGVVAGSRSLNPLGSWLLRDSDDGIVSVASTRLEGMADFRVIPRSHAFLVRSKRTADEVAHFLRHGHFAPESGG
jgi:pimeloyl-ACP methyl ester carboxylesterase